MAWARVEKRQSHNRHFPVCAYFCPLVSLTSSLSFRYGPPTRTDYRIIVENISSRVSWQVGFLVDFVPCFLLQLLFSSFPNLWGYVVSLIVMCWLLLIDSSTSFAFKGIQCARGPLTMGARVCSQMCSVWACGLFLKAEGFQTRLPTYLVLAALFTGLAFAPCEMCGPPWVKTLLLRRVCLSSL